MKRKSTGEIYRKSARDIDNEREVQIPSITWKEMKKEKSFESGRKVLPTFLSNLIRNNLKKFAEKKNSENCFKKRKMSL